MAATKITINPNGPVRIEGDFEIVDAAGKPYGLAGRKVISLCRCGQSANKPFCDGAHQACGFNHTGESFDLNPPARPPA